MAGNPAAVEYASLASVKDAVKSGTELSATAQKFFDYITSSEAGEIISSAGAVPVNK